jgi:hypothetical protein
VKCQSVAVRSVDLLEALRVVVVAQAVAVVGSGDCLEPQRPRQLAMQSVMTDLPALDANPQFCCATKKNEARTTWFGLFSLTTGTPKLC